VTLIVKILTIRMLSMEYRNSEWQFKRQSNLWHHAIVPGQGRVVAVGSTFKVYKLTEDFDNLLKKLRRPAFVFLLGCIECMRCRHDVRGVSPSVCPSVCLEAQLGVTVQKRLNGWRCCLGLTLLNSHGTLCYTGVLVSHRQGRGPTFKFWDPFVSPERLKLEIFRELHIAADPIPNYAK